MTATILGLATHLANLVLQLALASIACFLLLVDGPRLLCSMTDKIPIAADVRVQVVQSFQETAISMIWATVAAAAAQSAVMLMSYLTLGVPAAFLAAGAPFLFARIPLVGITPIWLAGAIYLSVYSGCHAEGHPQCTRWSAWWPSSAALGCSAS